MIENQSQYWAATSKRKPICNKFYPHSIIVYLFQETHSTPDIESMWDKEWPGEIIYNYGENNTRHTIIALNPKLKPNLHDASVDEQVISINLDSTILSATLH